MKKRGGSIDMQRAQKPVEELRGEKHPIDRNLGPLMGVIVILAAVFFTMSVGAALQGRQNQVLVAGRSLGGRP